uniref:BHLH domain-containing protein n=1 Tax=Fusarium oxysporum (strain Fo5176) TaxID=660025 RepID=A0A0D2YIH0_FUSOF
MTKLSGASDSPKGCGTQRDSPDARRVETSQHIETSPSLDAQIIMSTAAIISDFNVFEWDGTPFSSKVIFQSLHNFTCPCGQDTGALTTPCHPSWQSRLTPHSQSTFDNILSQFEQEGPQSKHSIKNLDSSWADMNQAKVLPPALTAGLLERRDSTTSNEESLVGLEKTPTQVKMRSASRRPKKVVKKPALPAHVVQARECHNNVEKQYRTRLKQKFERLLAVLQASKAKDESGHEEDPEAPGCGYSRGEVLDFARQRILALEEENRHLSDQIQHLDRGFTIV